MITSQVFSSEPRLHDDYRGKDHPYCTGCRRMFESQDALNTHLQSFVHQWHCQMCATVSWIIMHRRTDFLNVYVVELQLRSRLTRAQSHEARVLQSLQSRVWGQEGFEEASEDICWAYLLWSLLNGRNICALEIFSTLMRSFIVGIQLERGVAYPLC